MFIKDLVTVYIPTHNRPEMLLRAIKSVISQSYRKIEIIISDDGSDKNMEEYVKQFFHSDIDIKFLRSDIAKGACHARNMAIRCASGEFITGLDDDDEFTQDRISKLLSFYKKNNYKFISTGLIFRTVKRDIYAYNTPKLIRLSDNLNSNEIGNQIFTKTEYLLDIGCFDENLTSFQDYDCWLRMLYKYDFGYNTGELSYIVHMEHEEGRISTSVKRLKGIQLFVEKHKEQLSQNNIRNLISSYYINTNVKFKVVDILSCITVTNAFKLLKRYIKLTLRG